MANPVTIDEILVLFNERDKHTQDKLVDILDAQKETENTLKEVMQHIIISEEDKRQGAEFKKEVREHIKFAEPILHKAKENQAFRGKLLLMIASFFIVGILGAFFKFG